MNDIKLQSPEGKHPVDENLRPILVGGVATALEVSKKDVRVNNLYVNGTTTGVSASDSTKLPLVGGAMTGAITTNSTFDGVDIATRDGILTSTTTTANAALPKAGGTMTGDITTDSDIVSTDLTIDDSGDITLDADGHVEFDGCAVGFDKEITIFAASAVLSQSDDSTDIDFRLGNKHELELTDNLAGVVGSEFLNLIFPATSGNFLLVISQDGTGSQTVHSSAWVAYQSDGSTKATNAAFANGTDGNLRWSGGSAPTLTTTADKADIISIYWDADNQTAFAVASLNF